MAIIISTIELDTDERPLLIGCSMGKYVHNDSQLTLRSWL